MHYFGTKCHMSHVKAKSLSSFRLGKWKSRKVEFTLVDAVEEGREGFKTSCMYGLGRQTLG
jgi:hypothetical protein